MARREKPPTWGLELQNALARMNARSPMLRMCSWCRKVRHDDGSWREVEVYVTRHSNATFTHGVCPECEQEHFPANDKRTGRFG